MSTVVAERLTRARIIDAAAEIASRDGIEALSMRRLADELGVSTMAAYRHIASKRALVEALLLRALDEAKATGPADRHVWEALERYPGLRFELRHDGPGRDAFVEYLGHETFVGLLVGLGSVDEFVRLAAAVQYGLTPPAVVL